MIPTPFAFRNGSAGGGGGGPGLPGLLDTLSSSTTIIGAWSSCRALKSSTYNAGAIKVRSNQAGTQTTIGFVNSLLNTAALLAVCVGGQKEGVIELFDQSGNANHMAPQIGSADCVIVSTTGTFPFPVTVAGGGSLPMPGFGAGNNAGLSGSAPVMSTAAPMPVSFGAVSKHFMLCVMKGTSGSGDIHGEVANFVHTGDTHSFNATTSCIHLQRNASATTGAYDSFNFNGFKALDTITESNLHLSGSLFDGAHQTLYVDRVAGTGVANTQSLGAGGSYGMGATADSAAIDPWCGAIAEMIVGTFTNSAAAFVAGDWALMQNNLRTFYKTP